MIDHLPDPDFPPTALEVLNRRYLLRDDQGEVVETPKQMLWRVAHAVAQAERNYPDSPWHKDTIGLAEKFYDLMATGRFLPNSPTLMNAGTDMGQLAACFVLPVGDSMPEIFDAVKHAALIHQSGGGTGFSFSRLRQKGAHVRSTKGVASGPVSFARVFDIATEQVKQGGKRRGANMGVLRVDHPDILEFIQSKDTPGQFENFNFSVGITDEFMTALKNGETYNLRDPKTGNATAKASAQEIWDILVGSAWKRGDPGVLFLDTINKDNPTPELGRIEATNPCVTGDTLIDVYGQDGWARTPARDLVGKQSVVWAVGLDGVDGVFETTEPGFFTKGVKEIIKVTFQDGRYIRVTPDHEVGVLHMDHGIHWTQAGSLRPGDIVRRAIYVKLAPSPETLSIAVESIEPDGEEEVFDVQVPGANCFFANGILVHNCGEVPLLPYEACNLGSINLAAYARNPDYDLDADIHLAVRFLDNVIDQAKYPLPENEAMAKKTRKIGLGAMGWADTLFLRRIPYDSPEAVATASATWRKINSIAWTASNSLALERGENPAMRGSGYRNATVSTIAPTGTLSILANCSSGIEPLFALAFTKRILDNDTFLEVSPVFRQALDEYAQSEGIAPEHIEEDILRPIAEGRSIHDLNLPSWIQSTFVTAMNVAPIWHLKMQAAFQESTSNAVSKTVNMPHHATRDQIDEIYRTAYDMDCKGVTIFRDGCRGADGQVLTTASTPQTPKTPQTQPRPDELPGTTRRLKTGLGTLYLTVNEMNGKPFEVFACIAKSGRDAAAEAEAVGRLVSLALRSGIAVKKIVEQLHGIGGENPVWAERGMVLSIPDAIARILTKYTDSPAGTPTTARESCPDCHHPITIEEGCKVCKACGWTKCGG